MDKLERVVGEGYIRAYVQNNVTIHGDVINKYYIEGMSPREISLHLLIPELQVEKLLMEARSQVVIYLMGK